LSELTRCIIENISSTSALGGESFSQRAVGDGVITIQEVCLVYKRDAFALFDCDLFYVECLEVFNVEYKVQFIRLQTHYYV
jgi:hypothetical protein